MKRRRHSIRFPALLATALFFAGPAMADYVIRDGNSTLKTIKAFVLGGNILPISTPVDSSGTPLGVLGNPYYVTSQPYQFTPVAGGQYGLSADTAQALTVPNGAIFANVDVKGGNANYTVDGSVPTTSTTSGGLTLYSGSQMELTGIAMLNGAKFICQTAGCKLNVSYKQ